MHANCYVIYTPVVHQALVNSFPEVLLSIEDIFELQGSSGPTECILSLFGVPPEDDGAPVVVVQSRISIKSCAKEGGGPARRDSGDSS